MIIGKSLRVLIAIAASVASFSARASDGHTEYEFSRGSLDYDKFMLLLRNEKPASIDATLQLLRAKHPDFMSGYSLMHESFSLQQSTFQKPRAIVYGTDARFVLSFNGDPTHRGFDSLEVMRFDERNKKFEFREIIFFADRERAEQKTEFDETGIRSQHFVISPANGFGGKCLACHGDNPKPNWDPYSRWPGAYGTTDFPIWTSYQILDHESLREQREFHKFRENGLKQGRYAKLFPSANDRPNSVLGMNLANHNGEKIAHEIWNVLKANPEPKKNALQVAQAILCLGDYVPGKGSRTENEIYSEMDSVEKHIDARIKQLFPELPALSFRMEILTYDVPMLSKIAELLGPQKELMNNWSLVTGGDSFNFSDGRANRRSTSFVHTVLRPFIKIALPEYANHPFIRSNLNSQSRETNFAWNRFCVDLETQLAK